MMSVSLKGQTSYRLDVNPGMNLLRIKVIKGRIRINHGMYTPDGGTWLCHPDDRRKAHYDCSEGKFYELIFDIRYSFGHLDRIEIVNPKIFCTAVVEFELLQKNKDLCSH